jgi:glyoxylase-like metal-dependent hydrolase (beta-lactamase superfamily II)
MERDNGATLSRFSIRRGGDAAVLDSALLEGVKYRKPDVLFDKRYDLDLGGVHARLIWAGPAHTRGDTEVFVKEDSVLVTGDVIHNKYGPVFAASGITPRDWIRTIDALAPLHPKLIVPTHSLPGGGEELIIAQRGFLVALDERAHALKAAGTSAIEAGTIINAEMKARYPDWELHSLSNAVARVYAE